jgi:hypothetical protein
VCWWYSGFAPTLFVADVEAKRGAAVAAVAAVAVAVAAAVAATFVALSVGESMVVVELLG